MEDGATFEENAVLKAWHYGRHTLPACSSPTIRAWRWMRSAARRASARPATRGHHGDDEANNRLLLEKLRGAQNRTARFVCAIALVEDGRLRGVYRGAVEGAILHEPRGSGGFGYDPLFYYPPFDCTFGEAGAREKFSVSHRGQALRAMLAAIQGNQELAER